MTSRCPFCDAACRAVCPAKTPLTLGASDRPRTSSTFCTSPLAAAERSGRTTGLVDARRVSIAAKIVSGHPFSFTSFTFCSFFLFPHHIGGHKINFHLSHFGYFFFSSFFINSFRLSYFPCYIFSPGL